MKTQRDLTKINSRKSKTCHMRALFVIVELSVDNPRPLCYYSVKAAELKRLWVSALGWARKIIIPESKHQVNPHSPAMSYAGIC